MGLSVSRCAEAPPPAAPAAGTGGSPLVPPAAAAALYNAQKEAQAAVPPAPAKEHVDYSSLPPPVRYEELQKEPMMTLKPELFEGLRFDFTKPLNNNFALSHSIFLGNVELPTQNNQPVKVAMGTYEFGANLVSNKGDMLIGRILQDGRMSARLRYELTPRVAVKAQAQIAKEKGMSQSMVDVDIKGSDWNAQLKLGSNQFYGVNYLQSVTPSLALGGEGFWLRNQLKSGVGFAARHQGPAHVATCQLATTGLVSLTYLHRVSPKVSLATELLWNAGAREGSAAVGYDYDLRQCRLRGRVDTDGKVAAYLEERVHVGVNFVLSGEVDHWKNDCKFGFGMTVGE